jgi:hypothetical protein
MYNNLLFKIIPNALLGNAEAVTKLVGMFSIGFGGPVVVIRQIDAIGASIEEAVNSALQIEDPNPNNNTNPNQNPMDSNELTRRGGKKYRYRNKNKKTRKQRKHRK